MARYFASVDRVTKGVQRVIVVESAAIAAQVTGTDPADWVETKIDDATERYAGIGDTYDPTARERFKAETRRTASV
jgi:hypothetical protein